MRKCIRAAAAALVLFVMICCTFVCVPCSYAEDGSILEPQHGIPLVIIRINEGAEGYGTIAEMNASEDHSVRCTGTVEIRVPDGYELPEGAEAWTGTELNLDYIRGRGNSTWDNPKKPYKIKLSKKADLFGKGKSKDWAMMANAFDKTLIYNRITSWLGIQLGMPYTPEMVPVDFVMVGLDGPVYLGSYTLSETVKIGESRVNISELGDQPEEDTDAYGEKDYQKTGGFLFNIYNDSQKDKPESNVFTTKNDIHFSFEDPEYLVEDDLTEWEKEHHGYICDYIQDIEYHIVDCDEIDQARHEQIAAVLDLKSAADYWLIQEFSRNGDAYFTGSTYFFKPRGEKMQFGPLWDFDLAWGTINEIDEDNDLSGFNFTQMLWLDELRAKDPEFAAIIKEEWQHMDAALEKLTEEGGILDQYREELRDSYNINHEIYNDSGEECDIDSTFEGFREWIEARRAWFNDNIDSVGKVYGKVTYIADEKTVFTDSKVKIDSSIDDENVPDAPEKDGFYFTGWFTEDGVPVSYQRVGEDTVFYAKYVDADKAVVPTALYLKQYEVWAEVNGWISVLDDYTVIPGNSISTKITWTSSDESIAAPDGSGDFELLKAGDVTMTASTINGLTADLLVHVVEEGTMESSDVEGIEVEETETVLRTGKCSQIRWHLLPEGKALVRDDLELVSSDDSVAVIDDNGVITAIGPGTADLTYRVTCGEKEYVTTVKVTVKDPEDPSDAADRAAAMAEAAEKARDEAVAAKKDAEAAKEEAEAAKKAAEKAQAGSEEALRKAEEALARAEALMRKAEAAQKKAEDAEKAAEAAKKAAAASEKSAQKAQKKAEAAAAAAGTIHKYSGNTYQVLKTATTKTTGTVTLTKAKNKKSVTIPATVTILGKKYKVTRINAGAFKGAKIRTVTIGKNITTIKKNAFKGSKTTKIILKTRLLKKAKVKGSLRSSAVKTVKVKIGTTTVNKKYVNKYRKIFTSKNAGRKTTVK